MDIVKCSDYCIDVGERLIVQDQYIVHVFLIEDDGFRFQVMFYYV